MIFKCKMCGGTIEFQKGDTIGICDSCGTKQTLPRLDGDRKANLYDRANHFRRNNDYDKAAGIYEQILSEDNTDAEAYWSLVLCRYGIEYVEDPTTHKRIPTVNRAQFTSIFADEDYKSALKHADNSQKEIYEQEAKAIDEIQKGILAISQKEKPFDVFICYKETDDNGRRTHDSVLANDLYHQLTQEGFKVFFSRITLEDKLGTAFEPYIFAALNSAKVMVVLGTKPEYFNAVWVKNEWSRYLALVSKSNGKKVLIPAYRDMDPYDLPEEFSHLQAQDMSKLGFMQDLIRGINKIVSADSSKESQKETVILNTGNANTAPLLKRVFMFLEDGDWLSANEYCEKVLDIDPECARAYLGKLLAELKLHRESDLSKKEIDLENNSNYQKAMRFGDEQFKNELNIYVEEILKRQKYNQAKSVIKYGAVTALKKSIETFESISPFEDCDKLIEQCKKRIAQIEAERERERIEREKALEEKRLAEERSKRLRKRLIIIFTPAIIIFIVFLIILNTVIVPNRKYTDAIALMNEGKYEEATIKFQELDDYKDSKDQIEKCKTKIMDAKYNSAISLMDTGHIVEAYESLIALDGYKDSTDIASSLYDKHKLEFTKVGEYISFGKYEQDNNASNGKEDIEWLVLAKEGDKVLVISRYALDCQKYNMSDTAVTWETCSLRKWLNETFFVNAFNTDEQNMIQSTTIKADKNPAFNTSPGNNTTDKVFLLSITEANKYFGTDESKKCVPTDYTISQGADTFGSSVGCCRWWLRSPGIVQNYAAFVYFDGSFTSHGEYVSEKDFCVRPCIFIKRSQDEQTNQDISINETLLEGLGQLTYGDIVAKYGQPKSRGEYFSGGRYIDFENDIIDSRVFSGDLAYDEMPKNSAVWTGAFSTAKDIFNGLSGTIKMSELSEKLGIDLEYCPESGEGSDITFVYKSIRFCIINQEDFIGEPYISPDDFVNFF